MEVSKSRDWKKGRSRVRFFCLGPMLCRALQWAGWFPVLVTHPSCENRPKWATLCRLAPQRLHHPASTPRRLAGLSEFDMETMCGSVTLTSKFMMSVATNYTRTRLAVTLTSKSHISPSLSARSQSTSGDIPMNQLGRPHQTTQDPEVTAAPPPAMVSLCFCHFLQACECWWHSQSLNAFNKLLITTGTYIHFTRDWTTSPSASFPEELLQSQRSTIHHRMRRLDCWRAWRRRHNVVW